MGAARELLTPTARILKWSHGWGEGIKARERGVAN